MSDLTAARKALISLCREIPDNQHLHVVEDFLNAQVARDAEHLATLQKIRLKLAERTLICFELRKDLANLEFDYQKLNHSTMIAVVNNDIAAIGTVEWFE